jgi:hypothetical protein
LNQRGISEEELNEAINTFGAGLFKSEDELVDKDGNPK